MAVCASLACIGAAPAAAQAPAAAVVVVQAQAGLFGPPDAAEAFTPSAVLPLRDGQEFGWRATLKTSKKIVRVLEELTLPSEPRTWGDPEPGLKRKTSADGRTATTEFWLEPVDGVIANRWSVTAGDPKGIWTLRVRIEDQPERVFRLTAR